MRTSSTVILAGLATLATTKPVNFTIFAASPNTQFWDIPVNANGGNFWIFRHVHQVCPEPAKNHCTLSSHTVFHGDDAGGALSLGSLVPGGQDIYLTKEGVLGYEKAHSDLIPEGAARNPTGFVYERPKTRWSDLGKLKFSGGNFSLCGPDDNVYPTYQLYIDNGKNKLPADCSPVEIGARANTVNEQVWSYD